MADRFAAAVQKVYADAEALLLKKHHDYGPKNIALSPGGALNGIRVRMHDKFARINNLLDNNKEPENESLRDSFVDLLNYAAIALMVLDGEWPDTEGYKQTQVTTPEVNIFGPGGAVSPTLTYPPNARGLTYNDVS